MRKIFSIVNLALAAALSMVPLPNHRDAAQAGDRVRLALPGQSMGYLPLNVAIYRGFFKDENIDIETPRLMPSIAHNALMSGQVDYHGLADTGLGLAARGAPIKAIFYGADRPMYFLMGQSDIKGPEGLKGKKVGISRFGGTTDLAARLVLSHFGVKPDAEATIMQLSAESTRITALKSKSIDAAVVTVPNNILLRNLGFNTLAFVGDVVEFASNGYTTTDQRIRERPNEVKRVLRALYRGLRYVKENRAGTIDVIKREWKIDDDTAAKSYDAIVKALNDDGIIGEKQLQVHFDIIRKTYKDVGEIPIDKVVNFDLLREVRRELTGK